MNKGSGVCRGVCRSRRIAEGLRRDAAEAVEVMRAWNWEPLEDYPGAGIPWKSRCLQCGNVFPKKLSHVQKDRGGCKNCLGVVVTPESARYVMLQADLEPLVDYPGSQDPWLSRCMRTGHLGRPTYSHVKARGHQCWKCRSKNIATALRFTEAEATAMMHDAGLEALVDYPGSMRPWKARCMGCGSTVMPMLHNIRAGSGGCTKCAVRGIDLTKSGYLYLVVHNGHRALKVGIANINERLRQHTSLGWQVVGRWEADVTQDAREIEREVLAWFRRLGIPYAFERGEMQHRGYTETASLDDINVERVEAFIEILAFNVLKRSR
ncbi:GIY-YIG nuclease family protein [Streptosporangium sp. LJ11]|uniref:GIY-YIG nuclease family protein n=1 Tax=Streptosporangium sp. LJ11 TaxID=3436927 RepID=UPI003F7AE768